MSRFLAQGALLFLPLGFGTWPALADDGAASALWPSLSMGLVLLLGAAVFFCFWLQNQISRLQHRLSEQVLKTNAAAKHLEEAQSEERFRTTYFHGSSQELQTPLNGVMGFMQLLLQGHYGDLPQPARIQLGKCMMLTESMKQQITTILELAHGRRGKLQLSNSSISLPKLMAEMETIAESLRLRHPDCQFEVKKLWPQDQPTFIQDQAKLRTILRNLMGNAFKFGKAQERNHVVMAVGKRNRALIIEVSDQGMGMSSGQISRIFGDPLPHQESSGFGLAMVRMLLQLMQGEMKISSEPGRGTRFTIVIPEQAEVHSVTNTLDEISVSRSFPIEAPAVQSHNLMKMDGHAGHVLVVDDSEINCEIIQEILLPHGYRISRAYGGRDALARMRSDRPDLVLLDLAMPEFSGENVMQEKRLDQTLAHIPVILITARASDEDRIHGLDLGADDYLSKPIIHQELILRVRNLLSRQRLTQRIALMEEREKLAQLGELVTDLTREIKETYADRHGPDLGRELCYQALDAHPDAPKLSSAFSQAFLNVRETATDIDLEALPIPKRDPETVGLLRSLRLQLAPSLLSAAEKSRIWTELQNLSTDRLLLLQRITSLAATHMNLVEQSQKSWLLMDGILEFHQKRGTQRLCRLDQTLTKTVNLLGPRLRSTGVRLEVDIPSESLMLHPADLMQVCISLITTLCQRLEMLLDHDKWLKIQGQASDEQVLIRLTCGGPRLTEAQALRFFDPAVESSEAPGPTGLHVARRIVLRTSGRLDFNMNEGITCFELELPKALTGISG